MYIPGGFILARVSGISVGITRVTGIRIGRFRIGAGMGSIWDSFSLVLGVFMSKGK